MSLLDQLAYRLGGQVEDDLAQRWGIFLVIEIYGRVNNECPPQQNLHLTGPKRDVNQGEERHT
jgi:hypothetical protein